jgi:lipoprotein signal peptidase
VHRCSRHPDRPADQDHHHQDLPAARRKFITSFFNLVLAYNKGAAFSFLSNSGGWQRYFFTAIGIGAAIFIVYLLKKHASQRMFCGRCR